MGELARGIRIDLGSDQTSLHNPTQGLFPAGFSLMKHRKCCLKNQNFMIRSTLRRHADAVNKLADSECVTGLWARVLVGSQ